jgi:transposase
MGQERRRFTDEFKTEAVALLGSSGRPLLQIASELGISPSMLRNWRHRRAERHTGSTLHPIAGSATPSVLDPAAEISRLRRDNDRLRMERDILKKAVAIFSEPPR